MRLMSLTNQIKQAKPYLEPDTKEKPQDRLNSNSHTLFSQLCDKQLVEYLDSEALANAVSYTHLTLPTTPYV